MQGIGDLLIKRSLERALGILKMKGMSYGGSLLLASDLKREMRALQQSEEVVLWYLIAL